MVLQAEWEEVDAEHHCCRLIAHNGALEMLVEITRRENPSPHWEWEVYDAHDGRIVFASGIAAFLDQAKLASFVQAELHAQLNFTSNR